jgi:hypothetical protein
MEGWRLKTQEDRRNKREGGRKTEGEESRREE